MHSPQPFDYDIEVGHYAANRPNLTRKAADLIRHDLKSPTTVYEIGGRSIRHQKLQKTTKAA